MGKTAVIFPGQGSQAVGMGSDLVELSKRARELFTAADEILGFAISEYCFKGPVEKLESTDIQQPAIFLASVAFFEALREAGSEFCTPQAMLGLSLGEYTALHAAGSLPFEESLKLVAKRGALMQQASEASRSGMVSIMGPDEQTARNLCEEAAQGGILAPANFNCPGQIVISGEEAACTRACELADKYGVRAIRLPVAGAFHSPLMQPAADGLQPLLQGAPFKMPGVEVIANVNAAPHESVDGIKNSLYLQVTHPILWQRSIEELIDDGFDCFVEVGPGRVLTGLMRRINRKVKATSIGTAEALGAAKAG